MALKNRIKELRYIRAGDLCPNPRNWRTHPESQSAALAAVLEEVGIAGALIGYETPAGIQLIDGHLRIRASAAKGGKPRMVPLWWDVGTLEDLSAWRTDRLRRGAKPSSPFVCSWRPDRDKFVFSQHTLRKRFRTACRVFGIDRLKTLTIHHGRHTFISHALAGGRTLAEVRDAAGHSNVSITSGSSHVAVEDDGGAKLTQPNVCR